MTSQEYQRMMRHQLLGCSFAILTALFLPVMFAVGSVPDGDSYAIWISRSGALIIGVSIWIEFKINYLMDKFHPDIAFTPKEFKSQDSFESWHRVCWMLGKFCLLYGTIVWGFGDLLFKYF